MAVSYEARVKQALANRFKTDLITIISDIADEWIETELDDGIRHAMRPNSDVIDAIVRKVRVFAGDDREDGFRFEPDLNMWMDELQTILRGRVDSDGLGMKVEIKDLARDIIPVWLTMLNAILEGINVKEIRNNHPHVETSIESESIPDKDDYDDRGDDNTDDDFSEIINEEIDELDVDLKRRFQGYEYEVDEIVKKFKTDMNVMMEELHRKMWDKDKEDEMDD